MSRVAGQPVGEHHRERCVRRLSARPDAYDVDLFVAPVVVPVARPAGHRVVADRGHHRRAMPVRDPAALEQHPIGAGCQPDAPVRRRREIAGRRRRPILVGRQVLLFADRGVAQVDEGRFVAGLVVVALRIGLGLESERADEGNDGRDHDRDRDQRLCPVDVARPGHQPRSGPGPSARRFGVLRRIGLGVLRRVRRRPVDRYGVRAVGSRVASPDVVSPVDHAHSRMNGSTAPRTCPILLNLDDRGA
ncbi:hypothetical protein BBK14_08310 [Parafrankia soli]|uniref:Uncharacterized protein n=1 Tax=Parafrankia soli TaxID=2599596 RepID=A0A1S1PGY9_9ACTN|nr:hypothetical protein BBK14_08310 [Parafrankia soli]